MEVPCNVEKNYFHGAQPRFFYLSHILAIGDLFAPDSSVLERYGKQLIEHYINMITQQKGDKQYEDMYSLWNALKTQEDYAMGDESKDYCIHCARPDGTMQSRREVGFLRLAASSEYRDTIRFKRYRGLINDHH